jgi:hypothetical protein
MHNEELHEFYFPPNIILSGQVKEDEMDRECSLHRKEKVYRQNLVGTTEMRRPLGRLRLGRIILKWIIEK